MKGPLPTRLPKLYAFSRHPQLLLAAVLPLWLATPCAQGGVIFTNLVSFAGTNGAHTLAGLVQGSDGNFYGTTGEGGTNGGFGTLFKMAREGALTSLYSFAGGNDGKYPYAGLMQASDGNFYGTTYGGGAYAGRYGMGCGTVFRITDGGLFTNLASFNGTNGVGPYAAALVQWSDGNLCGTTAGGGVIPFDYGYGTVFEITTNSILRSLFLFPGGTGSRPTNGMVPYAGLAVGRDGNLYGTTSGGGANVEYGTVFRIDTNGIFTRLFSFNGSNGDCPFAGLIQANDGNFYGTTTQGGASRGDPNSINNCGYGTVFKMTPDGTLTTLFSFNVTNGAYPYAALVQGADGNLYGTTESGGSHTNVAPSGNVGDGTIFQITTNGALTTLFEFNGTNGSSPIGGLVQGTDGNFYGTTDLGGAYNLGTIFRLSVPMPPVFQSVTQSNGILAFTWSAVAGQTYQVQYNTDLPQNNWFNLGSTNAATNGTMSASDAIGPDPQRFYRVVLLP